jgi:VCPO second helical-bundle domain
VSIAVWECKRFYDYVRPVSAIHFLYEDQSVQAWGGPFQGTKEIPGDQFQSYIPTPAFAEYVAGHSAFSSASAEILKSFTGSDRFGASVTVLAGSSRVEPGVVPARDITLEWPTFTDAANQAGLSRRYGGIHFLHGDFKGRSLGRKVAAKAWAKAEMYFEGPAGEPECEEQDPTCRNRLSAK